jgi:hypothetical protein
MLHMTQVEKHIIKFMYEILNKNIMFFFIFNTLLNHYYKSLCISVGQHFSLCNIF